MGVLLNRPMGVSPGHYCIRPGDWGKSCISSGTTISIYFISGLRTTVSVHHVWNNVFSFQKEMLFMKALRFAVFVVTLTAGILHRRPFVGLLTKARICSRPNNSGDWLKWRANFDTSRT
jgi:hypothetical protein